MSLPPTPRYRRPTRGPALWVGLSLGCAALCGPVPAQADSAFSSAGESSSVTVTVAGDRQHTRAMAQLLEAIVQARRGDVQVVFVEQTQMNEAPTQAAELRLRLDTRNPKRWELRLWHAGRSWRRVIEGGIAEDAAAVEAAALVGGRAVLARLQEPEHTDLRTWQPEQKQQPEPTNAKADSGTRINATPNDLPDAAASPAAGGTRLSLGYAMSVPGTDGALQSGAQLRVTHHLGGLALIVGGSASLPMTTQHELGQFQLQRWQLEAGLGYRFAAAESWLQPSVCLLLESTLRSETQPEPGIAATDPARLWQGGVLPSLLLGRHLTETLGVGARLGAEVYFEPPQFETSDGTTLLASRGLRPRGELFAHLVF